MPESTLKLVDLIGKIAGLAEKGELRNKVARIFVEGKTPNPKLGEALTALGIQTHMSKLPDFTALSEQNELWADKAEKLLGKRLPKVGMSYYFLMNLQALWVTKEFIEIEDKVTSMELAQSLVRLPLALVAAGLGTSVDNLPVKLLRTGDLEGSLQMALAIRELNKLKLETGVAKLAVNLTGTIMPAFFGLLIHLEETVAPNYQGFGNKELLALWAEKDGASPEDLREARRLAEKFYADSASNSRIDRLASK